MREAFYVSGSSLKRATESVESIVNDPRGLVHVWEEPLSYARYIIGCDPSVGITGWRRDLSTDGDNKTDNSAIEVYRVDALKMPVMKDGQPEIDPVTKASRFLYRDLQVAEFFAPVDAVEAGRICNLIGRIYAGDQDDQAELIYEAYPGPGVLTTQELLRLGYMNLWYWETIADAAAEPTKAVGWHSNVNTQKVLWYRARRHLLERRVKIQSQWLHAEYSNAVIDMEKMRARAAYGFHDDLIQASNMALWAAHKWTYDPERTWEPVTETPTVDPQRYAPGMDDHRSWRDMGDSFWD